MRSGKSRLLSPARVRVIKEIVVTTDTYPSCQLYVVYTILSNILLSRLSPCAEEIAGDHQCGFRLNRSTTDHTFCISQILKTKWE
jgi:hypothetical protein